MAARPAVWTHAMQCTQAAPQTCLLAFNSTRASHQTPGNAVGFFCDFAGLPVLCCTSLGAEVLVGAGILKTPVLQLTASITELCTARESVFAELTSRHVLLGRKFHASVGDGKKSANASLREQLQRKTRQRSAGNRSQKRRRASRAIHLASASARKHAPRPGGLRGRHL